MLCEAARMLRRNVLTIVNTLLTAKMPEADRRAVIHELRVQLEELECTFDGHEGEQ